VKTLLISYDLQTPGKDYTKLWEYLRSYSTRAKPLESVWLIKTDKTAKEIKKLIRDNYVDSNDKILVIDVTGAAASWNNLSAQVSTWIKDNL
jgi:hypothetical protein